MAKRVIKSFSITLESKEWGKLFHFQAEIDFDPSYFLCMSVMGERESLEAEIGTLSPQRTHLSSQA